ncbi:uncharacterized protein GGS22DRAFT_99903 [Annulohypoxylon maeteangense]|uniref:uncharacterized protein n=1 Tax=Annulohypoxylon maeteangense TaxID=1927788 RepID=UPI0020080248|nr:uncharacterized protein GGS22DRAFT_99903 [Annulohypoxylon maeteangense]KAI0880110.1 hypothetical protein GGS22DRAFT_99903 [Annulohypoxylon maeteangense]
MVRIIFQRTPLRILGSTTHQLYRPSIHPLSRRAMSSAINPNTSANSQVAASTQTPKSESVQNGAASQKTPLPLPEPDHTGDTTQLLVGGEGVKLDHLGPLIVNEDGTMSRISNWGEMAEIERQNTLRILGRRNKQRLDALKAKAQTQASSQPGE